MEQTWAISHSEDGFFVVLYTEPSWVQIPDRIGGAIMEVANRVPGEILQNWGHRLGSRLVFVADKRRKFVLKKPLSDMEAIKLDPEFFQEYDSLFWDEKDA